MAERQQRRRQTEREKDKGRLTEKDNGREATKTETERYISKETERVKVTKTATDRQRQPLVGSGGQILVTCVGRGAYTINSTATMEHHYLQIEKDDRMPSNVTYNFI